MTKSKKKVLIIDDDCAIREYLRFLLEELHLQIFEAQNGDEGLAILAQQQIDLIFTDLIMPVKEGIETIRAIKKDYPLCTIVAMSGSVNRDSYLPLTLALGANAILCKPFIKEDVFAVLRAALDTEATFVPSCEYP